MDYRLRESDASRRGASRARTSACMPSQQFQTLLFGHKFGEAVSDIRKIYLKQPKRAENSLFLMTAYCILTGNDAIKFINARASDSGFARFAMNVMMGYGNDHPGINESVFYPLSTAMKKPELYQDINRELHVVQERNIATFDNGKLAPDAHKGGCIGAVGRAEYDAVSDRNKGIIPIFFSGRKELVDFLNHHPEESKEASRTTLRIFLTVDLYREMKACPPPNYGIEATIPIKGGVLAYFGKNAPSRQLSPSSSDEVAGILGEVEKIQPMRMVDAKSRVDGLGYISLRKKGEWGERDLEMVAMLYGGAFSSYPIPLSVDNIRDTILGDNNVFFARDKYGRIVSLIVAEERKFKLKNGEGVHLIELTDFATSGEHGGKGIGTALNMLAVSAIRRNYPDAIIYSECIATDSSANAVMAKTGMACAGLLPNHCAIGSGKRQEPYDSLNVWYLPKTDSGVII